MRAVKSVLNFAGRMKRNKNSGPMQSEEDVLIQVREGVARMRRQRVWTDDHLDLSSKRFTGRR